MAKKKRPQFEIKPAFKAERNPDAPEWHDQVMVGPLPDQPYWKLRPHQLRAFSVVAGHILACLNQPTASGKTVASCAVAFQYLRRNRHGLVIIAVPQTIIGTGFRELHFVLPGSPEEAIDWVPPSRYYLCAGSFKSKVSALYSALLGPRPQDPNLRIVVCSHHTLALALTRKRSHEAFRNVLIILDEAHHCQFDAEGEELSNRLGTLVKRAVEHPETKINLLLSTATFFRGDCRGIVGPYRDSFVISAMDYAEFLDSCHWLKTITYNYALYDYDGSEDGGDYSGIISEIYKRDPRAKLIAFIPPVGGTFSAKSTEGGVEGKFRDVYKVWQGVSGRKKPRIEVGPEVTKIWRGKDCQIWVDLVDDTVDREARKRYIERAHRGEVPLDGIVCLGMFHEGANWQQANTALIVGPKNSLTDLVQMIGRLLRDYRGKTNVTIYHALPVLDDGDNHEAYQEQKLKAFCGALMLEELYAPIRLPRREMTRTEVKKGRLLELAGGDLTNAQEATEDILKQWIIRGKPGDRGNSKIYREVVAEILRDSENFGEVSEEDIAVVHEQLSRAIERKLHPGRNPFKTRALLAVEDLDMQLLREGLPTVFDAPGLRRYKAYLLEHRGEWYTRFWSYILKYLYKQHGYILRCSTDSLGHHSLHEPVPVTCPQGHSCAISPHDFARRVRCTECSREPRDKEADRVGEPDELRVPSNYVCEDEYKLGQFVSCVRTGQYSLSDEQRSFLADIGLTTYRLRRTLAIDEVRSIFVSCGYWCDLTNYKNNGSRIRCQCSENHPIYETTVQHFKDGSRCMHCSGKAKYTLKEVAEFLHSMGYEAVALSKEYCSSHSSLHLKCSGNHHWSATFSQLKQGFGRCQQCGGMRRRTVAEATGEFAALGFKLLGTEEYQNSKTPVSLKCRSGHIFKANLNNVKDSGSGCPICCRNKRRVSPEQVAQMFRSAGFVIDLDTYTAKRDWVNLTCLACGHKFRRNGNSFLRSGSGCPVCLKAEKRQ